MCRKFWKPNIQQTLALGSLHLFVQHHCRALFCTRVVLNRGLWESLPVQGAASSPTFLHSRHWWMDLAASAMLAITPARAGCRLCSQTQQKTLANNQSPVGGNTLLFRQAPRKVRGPSSEREGLMFVKLNLRLYSSYRSQGKSTRSHEYVPGISMLGGGS